MPSSRVPRLATLVCTGLATLMSAWLAIMHVRMIVSPAPQEMREGASVWITQLLLEGRNPFALAELPASTNVYGIVYYLTVLPLARLLGNSFAVHRAVSAAAILGACVLLYRILRRRGTDRVLALTGTLLFYASSVYFVAPVARPDGLGMLLVMVSVSCLFANDARGRQLAVGLVAALFALLTKVYLAYPPFVAAAYLFLFVSRRRGLILALGTLAASFATLLAATRIYPAYISLTVLANGQDAAYDLRHMLSQTGDWVVFSLPLVAAVVLAVADVLLGRSAGRDSSAIAQPWRPDPFAFGAVANGLVFAALLGGHPGAHMTYLFQLVTPLLILAVFPVVSRRDWPRAVVAACLPLGLLWSASYFPLSFARFAAAERTFATVDAAISGRQQVLGSTEVAGLLALSGRPVLDSGQSEYFWHAAAETAIPGVVPASALTSRWDGFVDTLADSLSTGRYDLIVRSRRHGLIPLDLVERHYWRIGTFDIDFAWAGQHWPIDLWTPREVP